MYNNFICHFYLEQRMITQKELKNSALEMLIKELIYRCKNNIDENEIKDVIIDLACDNKTVYQTEIDLPMLEMARSKIDNAFVTGI